MHIKYRFLIFCLFTALCAKAQNSNSNGQDIAQAPRIFTYVEQMPSPKFEISRYLQENLHYPDSARVHDIQGKVIVKFVVNEEGAVENCTLMKGMGWGCDDEALRVVREMPGWTPGHQDGKPVKVYFTLPINFVLQKGK